MNFNDVLKDLVQAQDTENDNRERLREIDHFLNAKDGQWEPSIIAKMGNRPRYTFDRCSQVVDSVMGQIEQADFSVKIIPSGGGAGKEQAQVRSGIIRKIEQRSFFKR